MIPNFSFGSVKLAEKVVQSTSVLMSANCRHICDHDFHNDIFFGGDHKKLKLMQTKLKVEDLEKSFDFRAALFCALVNPENFTKYGNVKSWYDIESICEQLNRGEPLYHKDGTFDLERDIRDQMPFIVRIQFSGIDITKPFPEESVERYEKYMGLVKKYEGIFSLKPPVDVAFVWKAHMADRADYALATKLMFGYLLGYDNHPKTPEKNKKLAELTEKLWVKHFGSSNDIVHFYRWYNHFYTVDPKD
jgi:hypothetical protein